MKKYHYKDSSDGIDNCFVIYTPGGREITRIYFWRETEEERVLTEADAKLICDALNAYNET